MKLKKLKSKKLRAWECRKIDEIQDSPSSVTDSVASTAYSAQIASRSASILGCFGMNMAIPKPSSVKM